MSSLIEDMKEIVEPAKEGQATNQVIAEIAVEKERQKNEAEGISTETLVLALKEKKKELKTLKKKNQKLEETYIRNYRDMQEREKDVKSLNEVLNFIFRKFNSVEFKYESGSENKIKEQFEELLYKQNEADFKKIEILSEDFEKQKKDLLGQIDDLNNKLVDKDRSYAEKEQSLLNQLKEQHNQKLQEILKLSDLQIDASKKENDKKIENLNEMVEKLQDETNQLLQQIREKDEEIEILESFKSSVADKQADSLLDKFDEIEELDQKVQEEESQRRNEVLYLRNQMDKLEEELDKYRKQSNSGSIQTKSVKIQTNHQNNERTNNEKEITFESILTKEIDKKKQSDDEEEGQNYFKDLIIKFIIYSARSEEKQAKTIRNAIFDYLKISNEQRNSIEMAVSNQNSLRDQIFFFNIFKGNNQFLGINFILFSRYFSLDLLLTRQYKQSHLQGLPPTHLLSPATLFYFR